MAWTWIDYENGQASSKIGPHLNAGAHQVTYYGVQYGVLVDSVLLTLDLTCVPQTPSGKDCLDMPPAATPSVLPSLNLTTLSSPTSTAVQISSMNLVENAGFEAGLAGWYSEGQAVLSATNVSAGSQAMRMGPGDGYVDRVVALKPSQTYKLEAQGKYALSVDAQGAIGVVLRDSSGVRLTQQEPKLSFSSLNYARASMMFVMPPNAASAKVYVYKSAGAGTFYADELSIFNASATVTTVTPSTKPTVAPTVAANGTGLSGTYFNLPDFTSPFSTRLDPNLNFNWGQNAPISGMKVDSFSVRWLGYILPQYDESYTIFVASDDGVRVWIDGQQVINNWHNQAVSEVGGQIVLHGGQKYSLKVEYYDATSLASIVLSWFSGTQGKQVIPRERLFPNP